MTDRQNRTGRGLSLAVLAAGLAIVTGTPAAPGEPPSNPLPAWSVLVLQPVGDKRVRPVTGAVVSAGGAVIVPADFAAPGDVLFVLDGGTDLVEHGRTATVRTRDPDAGIAVLDVSGLSREPARFASVQPADDEVVHLAAFPPAEQIAEGAAPLWLPAAAGRLFAAAGAPGDIAGGLPNVSGPLIDRCGRLAGFSLAAGVPGLAPAPGTAYATSEALQSALQRAGIVAAVGECDSSPAPGAVDAPMREAGAPATGAADPPAAPASATARGPSTAAAPDAGAAPRLVWIAAALGLLAAGLAVWKFRSRRPTVRPGLLEDTVVRRSAIAVDAEEPGPDSSGVASQADFWTLELQGLLPGGAAFSRNCVINPAAIDVVIGSGPVDLRIDAAGIDREHARLGGSAGAVTLSDLGGPGGTWINRVPCTRGEIMFVADGDTVVLGETSFRVTVVPPGRVEPAGSDQA